MGQTAKCEHAEASRIQAYYCGEPGMRTICLRIRNYGPCWVLERYLWCQMSVHVWAEIWDIILSTRVSKMNWLWKQIIEMMKLLILAFFRQIIWISKKKENSLDFTVHPIFSFTLGHGMSNGWLRELFSSCHVPLTMTWSWTFVSLWTEGVPSSVVKYTKGTKIYQGWLWTQHAISYINILQRFYSWFEIWSLHTYSLDEINNRIEILRHLARDELNWFLVGVARRRGSFLIDKFHTLISLDSDKRRFNSISLVLLGKLLPVQHNIFLNSQLTSFWYFTTPNTSWIARLKFCFVLKSFFILHLFFPSYFFYFP